VPRLPDRDPRRAVLSALHAATGVVQTYDGLLTMRVIRAGGTESNPLMRPVAGHEGAMMGVKVAAAVATVIGTETLWRDNHRIAAIVPRSSPTADGHGRQAQRRGVEARRPVTGATSTLSSWHVLSG
jgi:hypothetical protein